MLTLISVCFVPIYNDFRLIFLSNLEIFCLTILHCSLLPSIVPSGATELIPIFSAVCVVPFLVFCLVFCGLLLCHFVCFSFNWLWCCLSFLNLRIRIAPLESSNSSNNDLQDWNSQLDITSLKKLEMISRS